MDFVMYIPLSFLSYVLNWFMYLFIHLHLSSFSVHTYLRTALYMIHSISVHTFYWYYLYNFGSNKALSICSIRNYIPKKTIYNPYPSPTYHKSQG